MLEIRRDGRGYVLESEALVHAPRARVAEFFERPENLEALTPPFLRFHVVTPPPHVMRTGLELDYHITMRGLPLRWRSRITAYTAGESFVDEALRSPYAYWRHTHAFEARGADTLVRDRVAYGLPLGPLGRLAHALVVRRDLARIFAYRSARMHTLIAAAAPVGAGAR
jgi:hypothetical protein